jgi:hypothetical protein
VWLVGVHQKTVSMRDNFVESETGSEKLKFVGVWGSGTESWTNVVTWLFLVPHLIWIKLLTSFNKLHHVDISNAISVIESISTLVHQHLMSQERVTCRSSSENSINARSCFGGLFASLLRGGDSKTAMGDASRDLLMCSLLKLVNSLIQIKCGTRSVCWLLSSSDMVSMGIDEATIGVDVASAWDNFVESETGSEKLKFVGVCWNLYYTICQAVTQDCLQEPYVGSQNHCCGLLSKS